MCIEYGYVYLNIILFHSDIFRALGKKTTTTKKKNLEKKRKEKKSNQQTECGLFPLLFPIVYEGTGRHCKSFAVVDFLGRYGPSQLVRSSGRVNE